MSMMHWAAHQAHADSLKGILQKAKETGNKDVIKFAKDYVLPKYKTWEDNMYAEADVDKELIKWYEEEK